MPFLVRILKNKLYWTHDPQENDWVPEGDIRADAFKNFSTENDCFSVYEIPPDDENELNRVLIALAATRDRPDKIDYAIIDKGIFEDLDIELIKNAGDTPDDHVNSIHFDAVKVTGTKLLNLTKQSVASSSTNRHTIKKVTELLRLHLKNGFINEAKLNEKMASKLATSD